MGNELSKKRKERKRKNTEEVEEAHKEVDLQSARKRATKTRRKGEKRNNPPSAYALFIRDVRNHLFDRKVGFRELTISCSKKWKVMSAAEKQRYHEMAKQIRDSMLLSGPSQRRSRKDSGTRKLTNYWIFAQVMRPIVYMELTQQMEGTGKKPRMKDVNREVGNQWRQLPQEEKDRYKRDNMSASELSSK